MLFICVSVTSCLCFCCNSGCLLWERQTIFDRAKQENNAYATHITFRVPCQKVPPGRDGGRPVRDDRVVPGRGGHLGRRRRPHGHGRRGQRPRDHGVPGAVLGGRHRGRGLPKLREGDFGEKNENADSKDCRLSDNIF